MGNPVRNSRCLLGQPLERISLLIVDALAGLLLSTVLRYIYRAVWEKPAYQRMLTVIIASYAMAAIWQPIKNYSQFYYYGDFELISEYGFMGYFGGILGYSYFLMLDWSGLYFSLKFYQLLQLEIAKSIRLNAMAHEAQLRMLRYQLNLHFLFNTLNAISTLILEKNTDVANAMVSKLSHFLRYSLDKDPMQRVDLEQEVSTMLLYLEIEQVRFDDRLTVEFNLADDIKQALVPSLILQPLVENSIKYAVANRQSGGRISVTASKVDDDLQLIIEDGGPCLTEEEVPTFTGVSLVNTRERLQELFGNGHSLAFGQAEPHGLRIEIRIPFHTRLNTMSNLRAIIVDDESLARKGLKLRLDDIAGVDVIAECSNGREALNSVAELDPDLVFLEIQMPGMSGFDVVAKMQQDEMPLVIFVTAYDEYAIEAFDVQAVDYLLKPIEMERLQEAVSRAVEHKALGGAVTDKQRLLELIINITGKSEHSITQLLKDHTGVKSYPDKIAIKDGGETTLVLSEDIDWVDAAGDYMCVHAND